MRLATTTYAVMATAIRGEVYLLHYSKHHPEQAINELGRWACNPGCNMTWSEAAVVSARIRHKAIQDSVGTNGFYFHGG